MTKKSIFIEFLGDYPLIRVLDYLISVRDFDVCISDLAENSHIGRATLYRIWDNLITNKIIIHTRKIGKAKLFKLNTGDYRIKKLIMLYDSMVVHELKKRVKKKVRIKNI